MKAKIVILLVTAAVLGFAGAAQAGGWDRGHHRGYVTAKHHRHHYAPRHRYYRHHYPRHYGHRHYRYPYYAGHRYYHHDHDGWKIAAGAVLLGSIMHSASHDRGARVVHVERTRVTPRSYGRDEVWYRTDSSGDCFEIHLNGNGDEVWTLVDAGYCD